VASWVEVGRVDDLREGRPLGVEVEGWRLAIFQDQGRTHALSARCPHANGPLDRGWVEEGEAVCPLHRWRFRLDSGRCTSVRGYEVARFPCEIREGAVWVLLNDDRASPG
jgi:nitrite reductase/ring-hydroxylating ferredoxin subunit